MATEGHYTSAATPGTAGLSGSATVDWSRIDTVLLDMDGTLLDLHFDNHFWLEHLPQRVSDIHNVALADVQERVHRIMSMHRGTLNWYDTDWWGRQLDVDIMTLKLETATRIGLRDSAFEFLSALKTMNKPRVLATNADRKVLSLKTARTGIDRHLERMHSSHDFGAPKEDQEFWEALLSVEGFDPARTLFIDDSAAVLRSAQTFGVRWLAAPLKPDSAQPASSDHEFATIARFTDLLT